VVEKIKKLGLAETLIPISGYFQQTLPKIDSIFCMGFIDCDLSDSVIFAAETIWPRLVNGGLLFFDDYAFENYKGIKLAVDKFVKNHHFRIKDHGMAKRLYYVKKME